MRYLLNSAVIPNDGDYSYKKISIEEASKWLAKDKFVSIVGYKETCQAIRELFGYDLKSCRTKVNLLINDECLVVRLTCRLEDARNKGKLGKDFIINHLELGLLIRK